MRRVLLLLAIALALAGCQTAGNVDTERYARNHEPKTGGPDL
jgi:hypothetical protein